MDETNARFQTGCGDFAVLPLATSTRASSERLIRLPQVLDMIGLGKTMLYKMMKTGEFPQPRKIRHLSVWVESEVQAWIDAVIQSTEQI
jgi:prophage regulatory protein